MSGWRWFCYSKIWEKHPFEPSRDCVNPSVDLRFWLYFVQNPGLIYDNECNIPFGWFSMWQLVRNGGSWLSSNCWEPSWARALLSLLYSTNSIIISYRVRDWNHTLMTRSVHKKITSYRISSAMAIAPGSVWIFHSFLKKIRYFFNSVWGSFES